MKCRLLFILSILLSQMLLAQDLRVRVISNGEPLGYAYIYVNGKIFSSATAAGIALVPLNILHYGDSISSSFVGAGRASVLYDREAEKRGEVTVDLPGALSVDEIVVTAKVNSEKLFRKLVNRRSGGEWYDMFTCDFTLENQDGYSLNGYFRRTYLPPDFVNQTGKRSVELIAPYDTMGYREAVMTYLTNFFGNAINTGALSDQLWYNKGMIIKYMGKRDNAHCFFLTRPMVFGMETFQTIIYVDEKTRDVVSAKCDITQYSGYRIEFTASYRVDAGCIYPYSIHGHIVANDKRRWNIDLKNIAKERIAGLPLIVR